MTRPLDSSRASGGNSDHSPSTENQISPPAKESPVDAHKPVLSESTRQMLENLDEASSKRVAADPNSPQELLDYWLAPENLRPSLLPILVENPAVPLGKLSELAERLSGEMRDVVVGSRRLRDSGPLSARPGAAREALQPKPAILAAQLSARVAVSDTVSLPAGEPLDSAAGEDEADSAAQDSEAEKALLTFTTEHAAEIASQEEKPFQPLGGFQDLVPAELAPEAVAAAASGGSARSTLPAKHPAAKKAANADVERRGSVLQKIARLGIKGRIQLAVKGTKEERSILVRDGTKIVALAVLDSPKITDSEVEKFASQKNVLEAVLRAIPLKRRFAKNYAIVRNLCFNPRTPIDVSIALVKNLLLTDLKNLSGTKEVSETVRKMAYKMFKQRQQATQ